MAEESQGGQPTEKVPDDDTTNPQAYPGAQQSGPLAPWPPVSSAPAPQYSGVPGKIRPTAVCILLAIVTLGIYTWFWYYGVHNEMQRHRRAGLGGGLALLLAIVFPIALVFITPSEVGSLYSERGRPQPVSGLTGLWVLLPVVGGLIWFIKTNGAINQYWERTSPTPA